jgi:glycosyltransferase involved in cell wall biosynthesis
MSNKRKPRVYIVTPVYNTAEFLSECIESVLAQTFTDFEYLIVDNASTDDTLAIAKSYEQKDERIRVMPCSDHLPQTPNYNRALRQIDTSFDYCKVLCADDVIQKNCLDEMVSLAETDPRIAIVGSYTILQNRVFLDGLDYRETNLDGKSLCRRYLLGGKYIFGSPSTCLYRMNQVSGVEKFYPENSPFSDADKAFQILLEERFGFVHQVLSMARVDPESITGGWKGYGSDVTTRRIMLEKYGPKILSDAELRALRTRLRWLHRAAVGKGTLKLLGKKFFDFHRQALESAGMRLTARDIFLGTWMAAILGIMDSGAIIRRRM